MSASTTNELNDNDILINTLREYLNAQYIAKGRENVLNSSSKFFNAISEHANKGGILMSHQRFAEITAAKINQLLPQICENRDYSTASRKKATLNFRNVINRLVNQATKAGIPAFINPVFVREYAANLKLLNNAKADAVNYYAALGTVVGPTGNRCSARLRK